MTDTAHTDHTPTTTKPRRAWLWPGIVVGMLCVHTFGILIVVFIATSDPSQAVVPDYHAKAVNFDREQAQRRASEALGWTCQADASQSPDLRGQRAVRLSLRDAKGEPLTGATVSLDAFHHARANKLVHAELTESAPGEYTAVMSMQRDGLWTLAVDVKLGDDHFISNIDKHVGAFVLPKRSDP